MMKLIGILLLLSFAKFKVIALNSELPEDLEKSFLKTVMIFHNSNPSQDLSVQQPDCFGNVLSKHYVLTAASCFVELNYMLECNERNRKDQGKQNRITFLSIKKDINIENTLIAEVSCITLLFY